MNMMKLSVIVNHYKWAQYAALVYGLVARVSDNDVHMELCYWSIMHVSLPLTMWFT